MKKCIYCNKRIAFGGKGKEREFCSNKCESLYQKVEEGFCEKCLSQTTDEHPGRIYSLNAIGTMLMGTRWNRKGLDPCPDCGSVVQKKWYTFGIGIKPLGTYRILYLRKGLMESDFLGRRLKNDPISP